MQVETVGEGFPLLSNKDILYFLTQPLSRQRRADDAISRHGERSPWLTGTFAAEDPAVFSGGSERPLSSCLSLVNGRHRKAYLYEYDSTSEDNAICQTLIEEVPTQTRRDSSLNPLNHFFMNPAAEQTLILDFCDISKTKFIIGNGGGFSFRVLLLRR